MPDHSADELVRRYRSGEAVVAIAAATGLHPSTVYRRLSRAGIECRPAGRAAGRRRLELPDAEIFERYRAGESTTAISRALGVLHDTVLNRLFEAGGERRRPGRRRPGG